MKTPHDLVLAAKQTVQEISIDNAPAAIAQGDFLIDVRESEEFQAGHLPGAIHMSRGMLEFKLAANPQLQSRDLKITLYCKTSGRAALCALSLKEMGYVNVRSIAGGFDAWQAAGFHVEKPSVTSFD
ncbi:MAG: Thiosulfate sulfurtransferase GlpE [Pseudomonadota bacterium]|jgi:rhodanese-related sulfurtransferase